MIGILGELLAPSRCAACDARVRPNVLFCVPCAISVEPADPSPAGDFATFLYGGAIATALLRLKYGGRAELGARLGDAMAHRMTATLRGRADLVVSVPLHPLRLAERKFDQAALLARRVAQGLAIPSSVRTLVRVRPTAVQASLDRSARVRNVQDAFAVRLPRRVENQRVLLVDDVRTTGLTLDACSLALRSAGAKEVLRLVLCRRELIDAREDQVLPH